MGGLTISDRAKVSHGDALSKNGHSLFASGVNEKFCFN